MVAPPSEAVDSLGESAFAKLLGECFGQVPQSEEVFVAALQNVLRVASQHGFDVGFAYPRRRGFRAVAAGYRLVVEVGFVGFFESCLGGRQAAS